MRNAGFISISGIHTAEVWQDGLLQHSFQMCSWAAKEALHLQGGKQQAGSILGISATYSHLLLEVQ